MKKLYKINDNEFGIDLDKVLCFYIDGEIDTYHNKNIRNLNILIGEAVGNPNTIILTYSRFILKESEPLYSYYEEKIDLGVDRLYKDLVEYYKS